MNGFLTATSDLFPDLFIALGNEMFSTRILQVAEFFQLFYSVNELFVSSVSNLNAEREFWPQNFCRSETFNSTSLIILLIRSSA